jgi:hypothetical protein
MRAPRQRAAVTVDIDWAPDFMIAAMAQRLVDAGVRATWFVTHPTPALGLLREHPDLFELGIHPNFLPGSTQGESPREILAHCLELVPEARAMRTHCLVQSTPLLDLVAAETDVAVDVSLFLPHAGELEAVEHHCASGRLLRLPYFWEDDLEMARPRPAWEPDRLLEHGAGLKIFDFHPVHVFLNTEAMARYQALKEQAPDFTCLDRERAQAAIHSGVGAGTMFDRLVVRLARDGGGHRIRDLVAASESR